LRARGQTVELRAADLSFTLPEAAQFLNDGMGLRLDAGSVAALQERTEGWIAGLQMAALSMRDRKDIVGFIEGFSGTNRYILDYLLEEVLAGQSPEIQRFLLHTSILERLTAPLCDAVLANDEGAKREGDDRSTGAESLFLGQSASILEYLERANLFLVPLMMSGSGTAIIICLPTYSVHNSRGRSAHKALLNYTSAPLNGMDKMARYWRRLIMHPRPRTMRGLNGSSNRTIWNW